MMNMPGMTDKIPRMWMWFHTYVNDVIWVKPWHITDAGTMVWSCFVVAAMGVILEAVRYVRWVVHVEGDSMRNWYDHLLDEHHLAESCLYVFQVALGYCLMLCFMTFSVWICTSLCIGLALGHFLFGAREFKK